jgi:hypothetical protein
MTTPIAKMRQSCTTDGIYVVQGDGLFNPFNWLRPLSIGRFQAFQMGTDRASFVSQDRELTILRRGRTSIAYRERIWAIELLRMRLSCTTFPPFVVQDKGGDYAA